jgi:hypothetical protein
VLLAGTFFELSTETNEEIARSNSPSSLNCMSAAIALISEPFDEA